MIKHWENLSVICDHDIGQREGCDCPVIPSDGGTVGGTRGRGHRKWPRMSMDWDGIGAGVRLVILSTTGYH